MIMNNPINLSALFLYLLNLTQLIDASNTSETPNTSAPPIDLSSLPVKNKQSVISTCHALRAVLGHDGDIGHWKVRCHVEVWNGKDQPMLKDLNSEQRDQVTGELSKPVTSESADTAAAERTRYLAEQAKARHRMCMEAKRTILSQLKERLPAGFNDNDKIKRVMRELKLSEELEGFINQVDDPMKDALVDIHAIENDSSLPEPLKLKKLRDAKGKLTSLLDDACKDDHPTIKYHNIGYLPHPDLGKVRMTMVFPHPVTERNIEIIHLPFNRAAAFHGQLDPLRQMAEIAAHHAKQTGKYGPCEAHMSASASNNSNEEGNVFSVNNVTDKSDTDEQNQQQQQQKKETVSDTAINVQKENLSENKQQNVPISSSVNEPINTGSQAENVPTSNDIVANKESETLTQTPKLEFESNNSPIQNYVKAVFHAKKLYDAEMAKIKSGKTKYKFKSNDTSETSAMEKQAKEKYTSSLTDATNSLLTKENLITAKAKFIDYSSTQKLWGKKIVNLEGKAKLIEEEYQKKKALLKEAKEYGDGLKGLFGKFKASELSKAYDIGKEIISEKRKADRDAYILEQKEIESNGKESVASTVDKSQQVESPSIQRSDDPVEPKASDTQVEAKTFEYGITEEMLRDYLKAVDDSDKSEANLAAANADFLKKENLDKIDFSPTTKKYWKAENKDLDEDEKAAEEKYQKSKALLEAALKLGGGSNSWSAKASQAFGSKKKPIEIAYGIGKIEIDKERKAAYENLLSKSKGTKNNEKGPNFMTRAKDSVVGYLFSSSKPPPNTSSI